jgi:uncharacterized protein YjiS (DUF1127 family)
MTTHLSNISSTAMRKRPSITKNIGKRKETAMPARHTTASLARRPTAHRQPGLLARLRLALALRAQRRALARADDRLLDDIGIDRDAALAEANRPVWDVPRSWLR